MVADPTGSSRRPLIVMAIVGFAVGVVFGWLAATDLAEPGGHSMDRALITGAATLACGFIGLVGLLLLLVRRISGAGILISAACAFVGFQTAMAVGPREPVARELPGSLTLGIGSPLSSSETYAATCLSTLSGDRLYSVTVAAPIDPGWDGIFVNIGDEPSILILVSEQARYSAKAPDIDPAADNWTGTASFVGEARGPMPTGPSTPATLRGVVSWSCETAPG